MKESLIFLQELEYSIKKLTVHKNHFFHIPSTLILLLILYKKYEMIIMGITDYIKTRLLNFPNKFLRIYTEYKANILKKLYKI